MSWNWLYKKNSLGLVVFLFNFPLIFTVNGLGCAAFLLLTSRGPTLHTVDIVTANSVMLVSRLIRLPVLGEVAKRSAQRIISYAHYKVILQLRCVN